MPPRSAKRTKKRQARQARRRRAGPRHVRACASRSPRRACATSTEGRCDRGGRVGTSASSATARSGGSWPRTCARRASPCSAYDVKLAAAGDGAALRVTRQSTACACRSGARSSRPRPTSSISAVTASQTWRPPRLPRRPEARHLLPRLQFRVPRRQDPRRRDRRTRPAARYVEGAVMTSVPPHRLRVPLLLGGPDAHDLEAPRRGAGLRGARRQRSARRRLGDQDVPQRDDQGPRGDGRRELHRGAPLRRRGRGDRLAEGNVSGHRLGDARRPTSSSARSSTGAVAPRRCARRRETMREAGLDAMERGGHRRATGLAGRSRASRACSVTATTTASRAAPTGEPRPTASSPRGIPGRATRSRRQR